VKRIAFFFAILLIVAIAGLNPVFAALGNTYCDGYQRLTLSGPGARAKMIIPPGYLVNAEEVRESVNRQIDSSNGQTPIAIVIGKNSNNYYYIRLACLSVHKDIDKVLVWKKTTRSGSQLIFVASGYSSGYKFHCKWDSRMDTWTIENINTSTRKVESTLVCPKGYSCQGRQCVIPTLTKYPLPQSATKLRTYSSVNTVKAKLSFRRPAVLTPRTLRTTVYSRFGKRFA